MAGIDFYEVKGRPWEHALCELADRMVAAGDRCYLWAVSEAKARELDDLLWTCRDGSFIPHGLWQGEASNDEPLAVGWRPGNPNNASCLLLARAASPEEVGGFRRVVDFVPMDDPPLRARARERFRAFRTAGLSVSFHPAAP